MSIVSRGPIILGALQIGILFSEISDMGGKPYSSENVGADTLSTSGQ